VALGILGVLFSVFKTYETDNSIALACDSFAERRSIVFNKNSTFRACTYRRNIISLNVFEFTVLKDLVSKVLPTFLISTCFSVTLKNNYEKEII
jgi:hypothetical protein